MMESVFFWGDQCKCTHTQTYTSSMSTTHAHTRHSSTYDDQTCVWCCTWQSVRQYRKLHLAYPFMSPRLLRYIVTANMKSGLFCQKCVNKHGNTSSEGHNSILHDKCCESAAAVAGFPQDNWANKSWLSQIVMTWLNLYFFPRQAAAAWLDRVRICTAVGQKWILNICESTSKK